MQVSVLRGDGLHFPYQSGDPGIKTPRYVTLRDRGIHLHCLQDTSREVARSEHAGSDKHRLLTGALLPSLIRPAQAPCMRASMDGAHSCQALLHHMNALQSQHICRQWALNATQTKIPTTTRVESGSPWPVQKLSQGRPGHCPCHVSGARRVAHCSCRLRRSRSSWPCAKRQPQSGHCPVRSNCAHSISAAFLAFLRRLCCPALGGAIGILPFATEKGTTAALLLAACPCCPD
jgi:hypothetical protein